MDKQLTLPIAERAALYLERTPAEEWVPSVIWDATLVIDENAHPLGGATIDQCKRGLLRLVDRGSMKFFPVTEKEPESVGIMMFYDRMGPRTTLFIVRLTDGQLELAWQDDRNVTFHRTGVMIDDACVQTWPALLESGTGPRDRPRVQR